MNPQRMSIVPSLGTRPYSPAQIVGLFFLAGFSLSAVLFLFVLLGSPFMLALPGITLPSLARITGFQAIAAGLGLSVSSVYYVARVEPLHRVLLLGPRSTPHPPSPDSRAVAVAFRWGERTALITTGCAMLVPFIDLLDLLPLSRLEGWPRISVNLLAISISLVGMMPGLMLFRSIVWRWLGRLHPSDVKLPMSGRMADRLAFTVVPSVAGVGIAALVVLSAHLVALRTRMFPQLMLGGMPVVIDLVAGALAGVMIIVGTATAYWLARRLGNALAQDLTVLTERIDRVSLGDLGRDESALGSFQTHMQTRAGEQLGHALYELARQFVSMRGKERQGRRAMEQVQRLRTQFLASMSHDLRSPLNSILGFATLISSGAEGPVTEEQRESIGMITQSARDLLRLVTNILDSARLEAGKLTLRRATAPAADILAQAVAEGRRMIGDRPLDVEVDLMPNLPAVYVDQDRVVQAVMGIFSHAIDAMESGKIRLSAKLGNAADGPQFPYLQIDVADSGQGIREADQAALFQAFREIQEPSGRRIGGLGLGLSVARELILAHGGDVWCESVAGRGTTFSIAIPLDPDAVSARPVRAKPRAH
jgi:signal transduction histidine kinase